MTHCICTYYAVRITRANTDKVNRDRFNAYKDFYETMHTQMPDLPNRVGGMAYYKDKELTQLYGIDPYHHLNKSQVQNFSGCRVWCEVVK